LSSLKGEFLHELYNFCTGDYRHCFGTGIAGTATFSLSGTGTVMYSGSGTGFVPGSNIKCKTEDKNLKLKTNFLGNNAAYSIEKARFCIP
jgi:hypothetical protein